MALGQMILMGASILVAIHAAITAGAWYRSRQPMVIVATWLIPGTALVAIGLLEQASPVGMAVLVTGLVFYGSMAASQRLSKSWARTLLGSSDPLLRGRISADQATFYYTLTRSLARALRAEVFRSPSLGWLDVIKGNLVSLREARAPDAEWAQLQSEAISHVEELLAAHHSGRVLTGEEMDAAVDSWHVLAERIRRLAVERVTPS